MKKGSIKLVMKWLTGSLIIMFAGLVALLSTPSLLYASHTTVGNITIYHDEEIPEHLPASIKDAFDLVSESPLYSPDLKIDLCLNDGSKYPQLVKGVLGDDVFAAFANKVVLIAQDAQHGRLNHWGQTMSYVQFLAHGMVHNYQFNYHGFWGSNPIGGYANWKWEGYVEYELFGKHVPFSDLKAKLDQTKGQFEWVILDSTTSTIKRHLQYAMMVKYCLEEKEWTYDEMMDNGLDEEEILSEMFNFLETEN
ncbi:hypothetical protein [Roseivirga misakiensis]|uniref:Uncharacterized protein n=1 Tax=Roseivirga misakiensis TaxID=1563681 RepID=A0A1E5T135_9BACT|nr:hypothetical protein [Roseivirga misakiensis]OEK05093.1 hypothetical protein BFP71_16885 [Roseivirga misakiensis]